MFLSYLKQEEPTGLGFTNMRPSLEIASQVKAVLVFTQLSWCWSRWSELSVSFHQAQQIECNSWLFKLTNLVKQLKPQKL